jgi:6-pyruvoyltetrahydropterin/6-carboxytetrahydropterin synthase
MRGLSIIYIAFNAAIPYIRPLDYNTTQMQCTRIIRFDAAHRIVGHSGKCRRLHGHRYVLEATFDSNFLDELNMVVDFSVIKEKLQGWIDINWDHNTILSLEDKTLGNAIEDSTGQKIYYLHHNPTAEGMAYYILHKVCPLLFDEIKITCVSIKLYETPNCYVLEKLSKY